MMRQAVLVLLSALLLVACGTADADDSRQTASTATQAAQHSDVSTPTPRAVGAQSSRDVLPTPPPRPTAITIPTFPPAELPEIGSEPPRRLDPEIEPLGVEVETPDDLQPGDRYWRAVAIQWHDPKEAAYRHYVWVRTRDKNGAPTAGQPVIFKWPSGQSSAAAPVVFPMYAAGHSYAVWIASQTAPGAVSPLAGTQSERGDDGIPSEKVTGMGLGTPSSRHTTDHVEYFVTFQVAVRGE